MSKVCAACDEPATVACYYGSLCQLHYEMFYTFSLDMEMPVVWAVVVGGKLREAWKKTTSEQARLSMREFESGATRDSNENKPDYAGFLSVDVLRKYGRYMMKHQRQADGKLRTSDNWKKGIPRQVYIESMFRHFMEVWSLHESEKESGRSPEHNVACDQALYALLFNVMGYAYEREMGR